MIQTIINTIITFIISCGLGYCINAVKNYKEQKNEIIKEFDQLKKSQLMDMRSDLSNKFYIYDCMEEVEDYLVISFQQKCERYFEMGGNHYIHALYNKSFEWKIKPTGYLK